MSFLAPLWKDKNVAKRLQVTCQNNNVKFLYVIICLGGDQIYGINYQKNSYLTNDQFNTSS